MRPEAGSQVRQGALLLLLVLSCKQAISMASVAQLQWLLWPLAALLNAATPLHFEPTPAGEWWDAGHGLVIVKACAGTNFLLASWMGYWWIWRGRPCGWDVILRAAVAAWFTTLGANALRILLIAYLQDDIARIAELEGGEAHRLIGICVYFTFLAAQMGGVRGLPTATALYLGVTLALPTLRAWLFGLTFPGAIHVAWTVALPLACWAACALLSWSARKWRKRAYREFSVR